MNLKDMDKILMGILVLFFIIIFLPFFYPEINNIFKELSFISVISTLMIAILTVLYIFTIAKQVDVMAGQLEEMKRSRELQDQPLPWILKANMTINKPRLFYSPPENEHSAYSRYVVDFEVKNIGKHPAVCIDMSSYIQIPKDEQSIDFRTTSTHIDTLEEKQTYPDEKLEKKLNFLFNLDREGKLLQALRENDPRKYPRLWVRIIFKNVLGGCFLLSTGYVVYPSDSDQDSVLENWLTHIASFPIKFKHQITQLDRLKDSNGEQWDNNFDKLKNQFNDLLIGDKLKLDLEPIPNSFLVEVISVDDYINASSKSYYGLRLPPGPKLCLASNNYEE